MSFFQRSPQMIERLGWVLMHSLWQFTLIALLAGVLVRLGESEGVKILTEWTTDRRSRGHDRVF